MCEITMITKAPFVAASELLVRSDRQFKIRRADGTFVHGVLKLLDVLKDEGFEFVNGMRCRESDAGTFFVAEAIYTGPEQELLAAIDRLTDTLGDECVSVDDSCRGLILRLPKEGELAAVHAANDKHRARCRAKIALERKQEAANALAWAKIDARQAERELEAA
jgi:hypothetical protein